MGIRRKPRRSIIGKGRMREKERKHILLALALTVATLIIVFGIYWIAELRGFISQQSCDNQITIALLEHESQGYWELLLVKFTPILTIVLLLMGLGWAIHGVGFKII